MPKRGEEDHERSLVLIATKGVVQLFNTVSEFQTSQQKQALDEIKAKKQKYSEILSKTGEYKNTSNKAIVEKLQSTQSRWKVLDPENGESDEDSEGNVKIRDQD